MTPKPIVGMNRREFTLALGAAVVAGGMPAVAVELAKLPKLELADILSGGLSVTFDYENGTKIGPLLATLTGGEIFTSGFIEKSGTVVGVSLYMDGEHVGSANLVSKQSMVRGSTAYLSWTTRLI
jgi:hypothetical protein